MNRTAAFIRLEGPVLKASVLRSVAYLAANSQGFAERGRRLGQIALLSPTVLTLPFTENEKRHALLFSTLRGMSEDRLHVLGQEYAQAVLMPQVLSTGLELLHQMRAQGHFIVVISEQLEPVVAPLRARLDPIDALVCNRLQISECKATGLLEPPVVGGARMTEWMKSFAQENGLDLAQSHAFGSHRTDLGWMQSVGHPCVVNPDIALRSALHKTNWPVLQYGI